MTYCTQASATDGPRWAFRQVMHRRSEQVLQNNAGLLLEMLLEMGFRLAGVSPGAER
jgi:hypothetical protein